jgi:hypothetical protein
MNAEPEAIRAFEHAGWQRAAAVYTDSFAHATAPFIKPCLKSPNSRGGCRGARCGRAWTGLLCSDGRRCTENTS